MPDKNLILNDYESISGIYDELMRYIPYREWSKYVNELFLKHNGKGCSLLDLGGGTGNLSIPLIDMGFDSVIVDNSHGMLLEALKKSNNRNIFAICADIVSIKLKKKFDLAICMYDTVNHLEEKHLIPFLMNSYENLREGGILIFDFNTDFGLDAFSSHTQYRDGESFKSEWYTSYDPAKRMCTLNLKIEREDGCHTVRFQERAIDLEEIEFSVSNSGFREKHFFQFLSFNGLKRTSERGMAVCIK